MEITILEDHPNPLLKRREYRFEVAHAAAATPSREAVRAELSKLVKAPKDRVIIERMGARYGTATSRGDARVYDTADAAKSITREHILIRNGLKEKAVPAAPGATGGEPAAAATPAATAEAPKTAAPAPAAESPSEPKAEPKAEPKSAAKPESKADHRGESKPEARKTEHKAKATKSEKDAAPAAPE